MTSVSTKWTPKNRDYVSEYKQFLKNTTVTTTHPLGVTVVCSEIPKFRIVSFISLVITNYVDK